MYVSCTFLFFFFFNDTATTEIYTLSLHDALPIWIAGRVGQGKFRLMPSFRLTERAKADLRSIGRYTQATWGRDRKSTRLNSSHSQISYAVFCLKKKKKRIQPSGQQERNTADVEPA